MEYAARLKALSDQLSDELLVIMQVNFESAAAPNGWKGLINDPDLDNSFQINKGFRQARQLLLDINRLGLPAGCEYLDTITPQVSKASTHTTPSRITRIAHTHHALSFTR